MRNSALLFISALLSCIFSSPAFSQTSVSAGGSVYQSGQVVSSSDYDSDHNYQAYSSVYKSWPAGFGNIDGSAAAYASTSTTESFGAGIGVQARAHHVTTSAYSVLKDTFRLGLPTTVNPSGYTGAVLKMTLDGGMTVKNSNYAYDNMWRDVPNFNPPLGYSSSAYFQMVAKAGENQDAIQSPGGFVLGQAGLHYMTAGETYAGAGNYGGPNDPNYNIFLSPLNNSTRLTLNSKVNINSMTTSLYGFTNLPVYFLLEGVPINQDVPIELSMLTVASGPYAESNFLNTLKFDPTEPFSLYTTSTDAQGKPVFTLTKLSDVGGTFGSLTGNTMPLFTPPIEPPGNTPEPVSATLFLLGAGALGLKARQRKSKK